MNAHELRPGEPDYDTDPAGWFLWNMKAIRLPKYTDADLLALKRMWLPTRFEEYCGDEFRRRGLS